MPETAFGLWLKQRRKELGITQDELVERIDCSLATLQKIESGERRPSRQIALLLAEYFGIRADEREAFITFTRSGSTAPAKGGSPAPWRAAHLERTNLPATLTSLIGREQEVASVCEQIKRPQTRLLTLTGPPGIGKTRLALQAASHLVEHFDDGVYFVDLSPVTEPDGVLPGVARALSLTEEAGRPIEEVLFDYARDKQSLLVLDNFEQVLDAALQVVKLLQTAPWLKVLVSSREALHIRGEKVYPVPPLPVPDLRQLPGVSRVALNPSVELFMERAQAIAPDFALGGANVGDVAAVCVRLEGLPLAIELAASHAGHLSPADMRTGLAGSIALLAGRARDLPARHRTLHAAIEWSYSLLTKEERRVFRTLGLFVGGFTLEAAHAVCGGESLIEDTLQSLEDKNLVRRESPNSGANGTGVPRFGMLESIRQYALAQLLEAGDDEAQDAQQRHAAYFVELAEEAEPELKGPDQVLWLARLEREYSNMRAVLDWVSDYDAEITVRLMFALRRFWYIRGLYPENSRWYEKVLARGDAVPPLVRARALHVAGEFTERKGNYELAQSCMEECISLARQAGDKRVVSNAQAQLGYMLLEQGDKAGAKELFEESLALDRELGNSYGICWLLTALGEVARSEGDYAQARAHYEDGLLLAREAKNKYNIAHLVGNLSSVALAQGDYKLARRLTLESIALVQEVGYEQGFIGCLAAFVGIFVAQGRADRAAQLSGAVDKLLQTPGTRLDHVDQSAYERYVAAARRQASSLAWESARARGAAMSLEQALDYVLRES